MRLSRSEVGKRGAAARTATLVIETIAMRIPDRTKGHFGDGRHARIAPVGRPTDLFGDVIIHVARVRAMEPA